MMTQTTPPPPEDIVARLWQQLSRASRDKHHAWRTPAMASVDANGQPHVRSIVLRSALADEWVLQAYTDARSIKCQHLLTNNRVALVFWSPRLHWQLRVQAVCTVHVEGPLVDAAWQKIRHAPSAKDFTLPYAPGQPIELSVQPTLTTVDTPALHFLAVLQFQVCEMDWLELGHAGHRRARITPDGQVTALWP